MTAPNPANTMAWLSACGDLPLFEELLAALDEGQVLKRSLVGYIKPIKRTHRNFYKWMALYPEAKGLISAKLSNVGTAIAILDFSVNTKREKRGRRPKHG